jgi:hypothetical protein
VFFPALLKIGFGSRKTTGLRVRPTLLVVRFPPSGFLTQSGALVVIEGHAKSLESEQESNRKGANTTEEFRLPNPYRTPEFAAKSKDPKMAASVWSCSGAKITISIRFAAGW